MALNDFLPVLRPPMQPMVPEEDAELVKGVSKVFKAASFSLGFASIYNGWVQRSFEVAPFDLKKITKAIETDSFVRQGFNKYRELIWKNGWDIISENDEAALYLKERIDFMELSMGIPFEVFLSDVGDQLVKYSNVFIEKVRGDLAPHFPSKIEGVSSRKYPVVGYNVVPADTIEIERNAHNRVLRYRQRLDSGILQTKGNKQTRQPTWTPEHMIHISFDKKPGRAFGTPFMTSVLDDIIALRSMEEDIQNLVHKELFPLYKYKVGTETFPAEEGEIDRAALQLENLASDGGLVIPERHDIDVIGADKRTMDASSYLNHFIVRVCVGLGLSPHHLGILDSGGNRSVTDRLDIALYDKVKSYQNRIANALRLYIFNELLMEGGFNPLIHPDAETVSDRCEFKFREIDVDTQVKKEAHILTLWQSDLITRDEARQEIGQDIEVDEDLLYTAQKTRLEPDPVMAGTPAKKPDAQPSSRKGRANKKDTTKKAKNVVRPSNQRGRRTSPSIRHDDVVWAYEVAELVDDPEE